MSKTIDSRSLSSDILAFLPGIALAAALMIAGLWIADFAGHWFLSLAGINPAGKASPISSVLVAILLGIAVRNTIGVPENCLIGIRFTLTKLLRLGIILVGIKLSIVDVIKLGAMGIPVVITCIGAGLVFITWFGRVMRLPPRLSFLIAAGTSICGVTAIVSTAPAMDAEEREVSYAVSLIAIFGMLGMLIYPYLARMLLSTSEQIGLFLGTAIHDTSQVVGAAIAYREVFRDDRVLQAATVTKLTRNLFLALVIPLLTYTHFRDKSGKDESRISVYKLFPLFVLGFIAMAAFRSTGDFMWNSPSWKNLTNEIGDVWGSRYLLGTAMAAVGLGTSFSTFKGIGFRPLLVGFAGALIVGIMGFSLALLLGGFIHV